MGFPWVFLGVRAAVRGRDVQKPEAEAVRGAGGRAQGCLEVDAGPAARRAMNLGALRPSPAPGCSQGNARVQGPQSVFLPA